MIIQTTKLEFEKKNVRLKYILLYIIPFLEIYFFF
jgi:hypothetical protein